MLDFSVDKIILAIAEFDFTHCLIIYAISEFKFWQRWLSHRWKPTFIAWIEFSDRWHELAITEM